MSQAGRRGSHCVLWTIQNRSLFRERLGDEFQLGDEFHPLIVP
jgi:hypothetical protein